MNGLDTSEKFEQFLRNMGYKGKIPSSFRGIYNPSTALLWDQLINYVHPRTEIQHKRNNLILNRLSFNKENVSISNIDLFRDESKYQIKEIEIWNKRQRMKSQLNKKLARVEELRTTVKNLEEQNNLKHLLLENEQQKFIETQKFVHLLNRKCEEIQKEISDIEAKLSLVRNLTPVENSQNNTEVLELLKKCSEKLQDEISNETSEASRQKTLIHDDSLGLLDDVNFNDSCTLDASFVQSKVVETEDHSFNELLCRLLYKNSRFGIFNTLMELKNVQKFQLNSVIHLEDTFESMKTEHNNVEAVTKLYGAHLECCLQIIQTENRIKNRKLKLYLLENLLWQNVITHNLNEEQLVSFKENVYRQRKEFSFETVIKYLQNFISSAQSYEDQDCNLQNIIQEAQSLNDDIRQKRICIDEKFEIFISLHKSISQLKSNTVMLIRKLSQFTTDLNWIALLVQSLSAIETEALVNFPLEYNTKIEINNKSVYRRDLPLNYFPYETNEHHFTTFLNSLKYIWNPTEDLLVNIFETQNRVNFYKSLMSDLPSKDYKKYTLEELQTQELFMFYAIEKLKTLLENINANKTQKLISTVEQTINIWLEMPFKQFVSKNRLLHSLPYEHYEKLFDSFYIQL